VLFFTLSGTKIDAFRRFFKNVDMRFRSLSVIVMIVLLPINLLTAQESSTTPVRTPEQEAIAQTERMQKELNLNKEQVQLIYEINLRHARERTVASSRSQALERIRVKDSEMQEVLTRDQYERLRQMRTDRQQVEIQGSRDINTMPRTRPAIPSNTGTPTLRENPRSESAERRVIRSIPGVESRDNNRTASPTNPGNVQESTRNATPTQRNQENTPRQATPANPGSDVRRAAPTNPPQQSTPPRNNNNENSGSGRR
jgi:hypothetical protein